MSDAKQISPRSMDASAEGSARDRLRAPSQVARVFLGLLAPVAVAASLLLLFLTPSSLSYATCALLYAATFVAEHRSGVVSPQTVALFAVWATGALIQPFLPDQNALQLHEGAAIFATLTMLSLALLASGRPLARYYGGDWGPRALHDATTAIWLVISFVGLAVSLACPPASPVLWAQPVLALSAAIATLTMSLAWFGPRHRRRRTFSLGGFTFRQLPNDAAAIEGFIAFFAGEIWEAVARDRRTQIRYSREEILEDLRRTEGQTGGARRLYFLALHEDKIVGTVAVAWDGADRHLPIETAFGVTFEPLRRFGKIMEVRRLCVAKSHRFQEEVIRGLFKCAIEAALDNDASFLVDFTFGFVTGLLQKVGFDVIEPHDREVCEFGAPMRLLAINFARRQLSLAALDKTQESMREIVSPYLRYRYVQRAVLRQGWLPERRQAFPLTIEEINGLCLPVGPRP
jgi:hypothetical protein